MSKFKLFCASVLLCLLAMSCEQKELCLDHEPHSHRAEFVIDLSFDCEWEYNLENNINWEQYWSEEYGINYNDIRPREPEGVRVHIYDSDNNTETVRNLTKTNSTIRFNKEGHYDLLFYNNDTEYIIFSDLESFAKASATTRGGRTRTSVMNTPDMLFGAYMEDLFIKKQPQTDSMTVVLRPLVFTYLLRFEVSSGAGLIDHASGHLTGAAAGVSLSSGHTSQEEGVIAFDCTMKGDYGTQALVRSFGIPDYPNPHYSRNEYKESYKNEVYLEVALTNGKTQTFKFDITDQMQKQPRGGVILIKDVKIEEEPVSNGGFNVSVNGWGEDVNVSLN